MKLARCFILVGVTVGLQLSVPAPTAAASRSRGRTTPKRAAGTTAKKRSVQPNKKVDTTKDSPSLSETLTWLRRTIESYGGHSVQHSGGIIERTYQVTRADASEFVLTATERVTGIESLHLETRTTARIDLGRLLPPGDAYRGFDNVQPDALFYALTLNSNERSIPVETRLGNEFPARSLSASIGITFRDQAMANRVVTAFRHAITLCQRRKEPF